MGVCPYCGSSAGFLRRRHPECERQYRLASRSVRSAVRGFVRGEMDGTDVSETVARVQAHLRTFDLPSEVMAGLDEALLELMENGELGTWSDSRFCRLVAELGLQDADLSGTPAFPRLVRLRVLREVAKGRIPQPLRTDRTFPFDLPDREYLIWVFPDVEYLEQRTRRVFRGGSQGYSIRLTRGVYYRVGSFEGYPVDKTDLEAGGRGLVGITNEHLFFAGGPKTFRIRHESIAGLVPYSDAVAVITIGDAARPRIFLTDDPWFFINLLGNISSIEATKPPPADESDQVFRLDPLAAV